MIYRIFFAVVMSLVIAPRFLAADSPAGLTQYVDPMIGAGGHGHVFVGANVPFGAVQLGPNNFHQGWDWCSGYHYSDNVVQGFSHLHLSGTGCADLGDVLVMPYTGEITSTPGSRDKPESGFASRYSHDQESARPGHYAVKLLDYDIQVDLTATERVGFHRYGFPGGASPRIAIDLRFQNDGGGRATKTACRQIDDHTIAGLRFSTGWARDQRVYFTLQSSVPIKACNFFSGDRQLDDDHKPEDADVAVLSFAEEAGEVMLKVGISPVSEANALANIEAEAADWDFDQVAQKALAKWNQELGVLRIKTGSEATKRVFYTALYHTMFAPALFNDCNGDYRGSDRQVHHGAAFENYTIFSLWDTYRASHPLYTITQPERIDDFINSMLAIHDQQGKLPVWHLMGNETNTMVGYHAVPVIVDAYLKGFRGFDVEKAYEAIKASAMRDEGGLKHLKARGYIPSEEEGESVAKAMEYAIDDWCIAQMAKSLGHDEDYAYFMKRAAGYQQYFDPVTGFMRGKMGDGSWREPFDPFSSVHRRDDYCEGNAWQYLWLVPQDVEGLIALLDGDEKFSARLDELFGMEERTTEGTSPDMSGFVGQYVHGNEPSHHIIYLYAYAGDQWKTAKWARHVLTGLYNDRPDGICGNEDCGQMSSWYLLSAMGLYPVNPAAGIYVLGSPQVDEVEIQLPEGKRFTIVASNNSEENKYIQSASLNGQPYTKSYLRHRDITVGGEFVLEMGPEPNKQFGRLLQDRPRSLPSTGK